MILYLDASALVKRYIAELGTPEVAAAIREADVVGTSIISRAETAAALAKAVRTQTLSQDEAASALQIFRSEWPNLVRVQATETLVARADALAWELGLRGYDAVHPASALLWQDGMDEEITFATFDWRLWEAAGQRGLVVFPDDLLPILLYPSVVNCRSEPQLSVLPNPADVLGRRRNWRSSATWSAPTSGSGMPSRLKCDTLERRRDRSVIVEEQNGN